MIAGAGAEISLRFGAKTAPATGTPIAYASTRSCARSANLRGQPDANGRFRAVSFDGISVVLNTVRAQCFDPTLFTALGIDPRRQDILVVKSTNHFFAGFRKLTDAIFYCEAGRPYPNDPRVTDYRKARLNIWPRIENPFASSET